MQLVSSNVAHTQLSAARASAIVAQTTELVRQELLSIVENNREIDAYTNMIRESINRQKEIHNEINNLQQEYEDVQNKLTQVREDYNQNIDKLLDNLPTIEND